MMQAQSAPIGKASANAEDSGIWNEVVTTRFETFDNPLFMAQRLLSAEVLELSNAWCVASHWGGTMRP
jgi:hypothetical protein